MASRPVPSVQRRPCERGTPPRGSAVTLARLRAAVGGGDAYGGNLLHDVLKKKSARTISIAWPRPVWGRASIVPAAGALPFGRSCCGLRRSAPDGACVGRSNKSTTLTLDASSGRVLVCARARRSCYCHCCAADGDASNLYRVGASQGPTFASRLPPAAQLLPSRRTSNGWHVCIDATLADRTKIFDRTLRVDLNGPREEPHIFLTALARVAQRTGFYARYLDPLMRNGVLTILASMAFSMCVRTRSPACNVCYTQISTLV